MVPSTHIDFFIYNFKSFVIIYIEMISTDGIRLISDEFFQKYLNI
jgi:hypothetical protein